MLRYVGQTHVGALAGVLALPVTVVAVYLLELQGDGDFRVGAFPYLAATLGILFVLCANGLRIYNKAMADSRLANVSISITGVGMLGLFGLFGAIAFGAAVGLEEENVPAALSWMPLAAGAVAIIGTPVGLVLLGITAVFREVLPPWSRYVPLMQAASIPTGMALFGLVDGTAETLVGGVWFVGFAFGWAVLGFGLWRSGQSLVE